MRQLIDYGRGIVATLQARNADTPPPDIALGFGSLNLALIIARITRGLMIAAALEARLMRPIPAQLPQRTAPASPRVSRAPRKPREDEEAELRGQLPSAREIAARIRKRPTGAVIVEICRDLGIDAMHPLWREIQKAVMFHGGTLLALMRVVQRRCASGIGLPLPPAIEQYLEAQFVAHGQPP